MERTSDRHHIQKSITLSPSQSDLKTSFSDNIEAYKQYYSTHRLPLAVPCRHGRFVILAVAVVLFLSVMFVRRHQSVALKTLGGELHCDPEVLKPSATVPDDVNKVRPADIKVIAAMGDSITVAARSRNHYGDRYDFYPGNSYITGGDATLKEHITVANILRVFNPNIVGMSHGVGYDMMDFNVAVSGMTCMDIPRQARDLIQRMKSRGVHLDEDWKLVSIFIGSNDVGELGCVSKKKRKPISRDVFKRKLEEGIALLRNGLNRTIVSIVSMWNSQMFYDASTLIYEGKRKQCGYDFIAKRDQLCEEYRKVAYELQNDSRFDYKDFTVVVQGFMDDIKDAYRNKHGKYDKSFYAYDVLHLSKYGNAVFGKFLWNSLLEPVGRKTTKADLGNDSVPIRCPTKEKPYIQTLGNRS